MNVNSAISAGKKVLFLQWPLYFALFWFVFGKWLKIDKKSHLISCGTAICGGVPLQQLHRYKIR
jgi:uncharacterized membrane protein YadS